MPPCSDEEAEAAEAAALAAAGGGAAAAAFGDDEFDDEMDPYDDPYGDFGGDYGDDFGGEFGMMGGGVFLIDEPRPRRRRRRKHPDEKAAAEVRGPHAAWLGALAPLRGAMPAEGPDLSHLKLSRGDVGALLELCPDMKVSERVAVCGG
ncbi:hypothetical protein PLESTF_001771700 [Pleodorina starrii]|nr:hypothetical protein PLESTF_001771700 [Pleodorina starrii]